MLMVQAGPGNGRTTKRKNKTGLPLDQRNRLHRQQRGWQLGCGISMVASIKSKQLLPLFLLLSTTAKQNQMRKHPSHTHQACNTFHDIIRRSYMCTCCTYKRQKSLPNVPPTCRPLYNCTCNIERELLFSFSVITEFFNHKYIEYTYMYLYIHVC